MNQFNKAPMPIFKGVDLDKLINEDPLTLNIVAQNLREHAKTLMTPTDLREMWSTATIAEYLDFGKPANDASDNFVQKYADKRQMLSYFASHHNCSTMGEVFEKFRSREIPTETVAMWARQGLFLNSYWHEPVVTGYPECSGEVQACLDKFIAEGTVKYGGPIGLLIEAARDFKKVGF